MPPLDVSWNPFEEFKYSNCFNVLKTVLYDYENYYIQKLKHISFSYIQISITKTIVNTRLFFDDTILIGEIELLPVEADDLLNNLLNIKDRKIINNYFAKLNLELDNLKEKIDQRKTSKEKEDIEESVIQILEQVTIEYRKINLESHPMDRFFQTDYDFTDNIFTELISFNRAPVSVFKEKKALTIFETNIKKPYDVNLPIPFTGEVQFSFDDDDENELEDFIDGEKIIEIKNAKTITEILIKSLKKIDDDFWVERFQYLGNGKLLIYLGQYENDFIRFNEPLFISLINEGYILDRLSNNSIIFENNNFGFFMKTQDYEPLYFTIHYRKNYNPLDNEPLDEKLVREEMLKFLPGFSNWNCIPALFNEKRFDLVAHFDWRWINNDCSSSTPNDDDGLSAKAVKFLSTQRKTLKYDLNTNEMAVNCLVSEVNKSENYIFSKNYNIDSDNRVEDLNELPYGFKGYKFQVIEIFTEESDTSIGDIILWKYKMTKSSVTIEYSIKKTTKELIMNIPFETTKLK